MSVRPISALTFAIALGVARISAATISLTAETGNHPDLFGSGMVLQRGGVVPVWGRAAAAAAVRADFVDPGAAPGAQIIQSVSTSTSEAGRWVVRFSDLPVGGPYELRLFENGESSPSVVLTDVLVGDVWLASGQSNMVLHGPHEGDAELYSHVRAITTKSWGQKPSGAAFYFAAELSDALGIPIGIVNRAQPDTPLRSWLPPETASDEDPFVQAMFSGVYSGCGIAGTSTQACNWYEIHIRPLERPVEAGEPREAMALRGIVWWQGEKGEDKRNTDAYTHLFPAMIRTWRANLGQPDLPFVFHQLPSGTGLLWTDWHVKALPRTNDLRQWQARQRIAFFRALALPATSLMTSIDLEPALHPSNYDVYGRRLGDAALGTTYVASGDIGLFEYSGPIFESAALEPAAGGGSQVRIRFRAGTADGLQTGPANSPTGNPQGFAVCCDAGGGFVFADARIENGDEVVVSHSSVATPTVVQYGIGRNPRWANLFNAAALGAAPFSTALAPFPGEDDDGDGFWEPGPYAALP